MGDGKPFVLLWCGTVLGDVSLEPVQRVLEGVPGVLLVVVGIDVEIDDVIAQVLHVLLTTGSNSAARVRWADVGGDLSNDVVESALDVQDLVFTIIFVDLGQVQVRPCVGSNLMSFCIHTLDYVDVFLGLVNLSLGDVVAGDEERSLCIVLLEEIQDGRCEVLVWPVIIGNGNGTWVLAMVDAIASVGY